MKEFIGFVLVALWLVSCYGIVAAALDREQQNSTTTLLYIALLFMFFFGGTGLYCMFM